MWSAIACLTFYLIKFSIDDNPAPSMADMILMTYGIGSIAAFVLIFEFDWTK